MIERYYILTGPPGSGKSMLLQYLRTLGYAGIEEPARQILAEQRRLGGSGLPGTDDRLFLDLMLSQMIGEYDRLAESPEPVFFDRGVPDILGYAAHFGLDYPPGQNAARSYRYNLRVFFAPAWEAIYTTDDERKMTFEASRQFGDDLRTVYTQYGYTLIELPCLPVEERAEFLLQHL